MTEEATITWVWWITVVEMPLLGALFWLIHHGRRDADRALMKIYGQVQSHFSTVLQNVAQSRVEVARHYATGADLKDVERRLTDHLLRLENRIAYAISAETSRGACTMRPGGRHHGP